MGGEDMILFSAELRTLNCAKAMNYLEVHMIGREELLDLAILYPRSYRVLRRQIALLALRRGIIRQAKAIVHVSNTDKLVGRHRDRATAKSGSGGVACRPKHAFKFESALQAATTKTAEEQEAAAYRNNILSSVAGRSIADEAALAKSLVTACSPLPPHGATTAPPTRPAAQLDSGGGTAAATGCEASGGSMGSGGSAASAASLHEAPIGDRAQAPPTSQPLQALQGLQGSGGAADGVVHALLGAVEALRTEVAELRGEQREHREHREAMKRPRQRVGQRSGAGGARPEPRLRQRVRPTSAEAGASFMNRAHEGNASSAPRQAEVTAPPSEGQPQPSGPQGGAQSNSNGTADSDEGGRDLQA